MQGDWIKEQFKEEEGEQERIIEQGYVINVKETLKAMNKIGKNKAPSYDGMMDNIF